MDVCSLSDAELIEQLKIHNIEYGPILDSTRRVYQKKLTKVLQLGVPYDAWQSRPAEEPVDELDYDGYEEDPEPEPVARKTQTTYRKETVRQRIVEDPQPIRNSTPQKISREDRPTSSYTRASRYTSTTASTSIPSSRPELTKPSDIITPAKPTQEKPKKTGLSIWLQLLIVIIIAFLIFLVFQNMEYANKIPTQGIGHEP